MTSSARRNTIFRSNLVILGDILAYISIGDRIQDIERSVGALADIKRLPRDGKDLIAGEYIQPELVLSPQEAFYSERKKFDLWLILLDMSVGNLSCALSSRHPNPSTR